MRASFRSMMLLAGLGAAAAVPAYAQSSGGEAQSTYAACTSKPSQADTEAAHGAYMAGKGSFDEADYTTAINYFKDAYRRDCTKHELLEIIARAYELQGNRREAVHALETYLERVPSAPDADVQRRHIANLKREISDQPSAVPSASAAPSAVPSASAAPSASAPPVPLASASAAPSSEPPPLPAPTPAASHSAAPWIVVGLGGAALVTGAVLYGIGSGKVSTAAQSCDVNHSGPNCTSSDASSGNTGRSLESVGVIAGSVGLAAVAGGLLWHFLEPAGAPPAKSGRPLVTPQVAPGYTGVGVVGRF